MICPRKCTLCGLRSKQVEEHLVPVSDYLSWRSGWQCSDHSACDLRRGIEPYIWSREPTNDIQVFS